MQWAKANDRIIITSDLDFGAMLATSGLKGPSVVQLRGDSTLPSRVGSVVLRALAKAEAELTAGALLSIDTQRARVRLLPFKPN
jgi:predicted nuclease of predicted toxin-antitoxin system